MAQTAPILDLVAAIGGIVDIDEMRATALNQLRRLIWFDGANFWLNDPATSLPMRMPVTVDIVPASLDQYMSRYISLDDYHATYNKAGLLIARSTDILVYSQWTQRSEYFNDFLRTYGIHYMMSFDICDCGQVLGGLCLHRDRSNGDFSQNDILILRTLYPHLVNIFRWYHAIRLLRQSGAPTDSLPRHSIFATLTPREAEIVKRVITGVDNMCIAKELSLSINTVKMHLQNVYTKLGIKSRAQLISLYLKLSQPH